MQKMINMFSPLYEKHKEKILYLIFGVLTTILNYIVYYICRLGFGLSGGVSTNIAWVFGVAFAYVTNKIWVFESKGRSASDIVNELFPFIGARILSQCINFVIVYFFVDKWGFNDFIILTVANVMVIIFNYFASKLVVFRKNKKKKD